MGVKRKRDCVKKVTASGAGHDKKVETATSENENKSPLVDQLPTAAETTPEVENGQQKKLKIDTSGELSSHEDAAAAAGESASTSQHETLEERSPSPQNENRSKQAPVTALKEIYLKTNKQVHVGVCFKLEELINSNKLRLTDLDDEKFVQALSSLNEAKLFHLFDLFVTNEQNFVCNDDDTKRLDIRKLTDACHVWTLDTTSVVKIEERELALCMLKQPGPDQQQLARTLESHRYELEVRPTVRIVRSAQLASACQRSYSESTFETIKKSTIDSNYIDTLTRALASPANRVGKECFLGRLPDYMFEDELLELLEPFGPIVELQLHIDPRKGASRGYAFVSFSTKEKAQEAIKHLDEYAVRGTHEIVVSYGEQRKSLYVGNVPGTVHKEQLFQYLRQILPGLRCIDTPRANSIAPTSRHCFLSFLDHLSAKNAFNKLNSPAYNVFMNRHLTVEWSVCQMSVPARSLHVRFFNEKASFDLVTRLFGVFGRVERVRFLRDHAYVDYANCYDAYLAREYLDGKSLNGGVIQVTECSEPAATTCRPPLAKLSSNYQSAGLTSNTPRSAAYGVFDNNLMTEYLSRPMKSPLGNFDLNCKSTPAPSVSQGDGTPRKVGYDASLRRL